MRDLDWLGEGADLPEGQSRSLALGIVTARNESKRCQEGPGAWVKDPRHYGTPIPH